jgi:hypothetical protein
LLDNQVMIVQKKDHYTWDLGGSWKTICWQRTCQQDFFDQENFPCHRWTQRNMPSLLILEIATPSWRQRNALKLVTEKTTFTYGTSSWAISMWRTSNC